MSGGGPYEVTCQSCGLARLLKHRPTGQMCRTCAAVLGSTAAQRRPRPSLLARLMSGVVTDEAGCWVWTGTLQRNGYGTVHVDGKNSRTHRVLYEALKGPIPEGLEIDHLCRNRACCNPDHLEPVTRLENARRALRTHCVNGHEFTPANTYVPGDGKRYCRECRRVRIREARGRKRHAA